MRKHMMALACVMALGAPSVAHADPSIWVQCDGQPRPEGAATTAARLGAAVFIPIVGLFALGETGTGTPAAVGQPGVDACTQALAEPVLQSFWQRHLNILRARAIHYIEIDNHQAALADLETMHTVANGQTASPLLDRSIGVSALLMEAALRARNNEFDRARELAVRAADARPYSVQIQQVARSFFTGAPTLSAEERRLFERELSYDPSAALRFPSRLDLTDDAQAAADAWEAALAADDHLTARGWDAALERTAGEGPDGYTLVRAALAMARAGRTERAEALAALANAKLGPESASAGAGGGALEGIAPDASAAAQEGGTRETLAEARRTQLRTRLDDAVRTGAAPYRPLLRAWLVALRGNDAEAWSIMQANFERLPKVMASADLLRRLKQNPAIGAQVPDFLIQSAISGARPDQAQRFREIDMDDFIRVLPQFERVDGGSRYRPGNSVGYRDGTARVGDARVTYSGGTFFATPEMQLLRAAQLAQERGMDSFLVTDASRTYLDVALFNAASPPDAYAARSGRFLRASDVIAGLGPIYIDIPAAMAAERRR
jgi:hypothetical protein